MYRNNDQVFAVLVCVWETMKTGSEALGQDDRKRAGEQLKALLQNLLFTCHPSWGGGGGRKEKKLDKRHERGKDK